MSIVFFLFLLPSILFSQVDCESIPIGYSGACVTYHTNPEKLTIEGKVDNGKIIEMKKIQHDNILIEKGNYDPINFKGTKEWYAVNGHLKEKIILLQDTIIKYSYSDLNTIKTKAVTTKGGDFVDWYYYASNEKLVKELRTNQFTKDGFYWGNSPVSSDTTFERKVNEIFLAHHTNYKDTMYSNSSNESIYFELVKQKKNQVNMLASDKGDKILHESIDSEPYSSAEFPGGRNALLHFFENNLKFPDRPASKGIKGKVMLSMKVDASGNLTIEKIFGSTDYDFRREAIRVVLLMPKWIPAMENGQKVKSSVRLPISFS